jgi:alcohol dehydrogenase (cytochrome c)
VTGKRLCSIAGFALLALPFVVLALTVLVPTVSAQTGPTQKELNEAALSKENWLHPNHDYAGLRFVGTKEITAANVARLRPVCMYQSKERVPAQSSPLVYDGVLYFTTTHYTVAIDATDCRLRWEHVWQPHSKEVFPPNRGD